MKIFTRSLFCVVAILTTALSWSQGLPTPGPSGQLITDKMGIDQKLGVQLPLDTEFRDESGKTIHLRDVLSNRPAYLLPIFYTCKGVCDLEMHEFLGTLVKMKKTYPVGGKFDVIMLSIHPTETPDLAAAKKAEMMDIYDLKGSEASWHFLTGTEENIRKVTDTIGFRFDYNRELNQINHPAGSMTITPDGRVSSYIYGAAYYTKVLEDKLDLAAQNKIGKTETQVVLLGCIRMNPATGQRTLIIEGVLRILCIVFLIGVAGWITSMNIQRKKQSVDLGGVASPR